MAAELAEYSAYTVEQWRHGIYISTPEVRTIYEKVADIHRIGEVVY
jgi:hypothetical protein